MTEYLFNAPWWLPAILGAAGIALLVTGYHRTDLQLKRAGVVAAGAGVILFLLGYFVQTPIERATARTRQLVAAADSRDWDTFRSLLHPQTSIYSLRGPDEIVPLVENAMDRYSVKGVEALSVEATQVDTVIMVDVQLRSIHEAVYTLPVRTNCRFEWQKRGDEWLLYRVEVLPGGDVTPDNVESYLPNLKLSAD